MGSVQFKDGKVLFGPNGNVAMDPNCCCAPDNSDCERAFCDDVFGSLPTCCFDKTGTIDVTWSSVSNPGGGCIGSNPVNGGSMSGLTFDSDASTPGDFVVYSKIEGGIHASLTFDIRDGQCKVQLIIDTDPEGPNEYVTGANNDCTGLPGDDFRDCCGESHSGKARVRFGDGDGNFCETVCENVTWSWTPVNFKCCLCEQTFIEAEMVCKGSTKDYSSNCDENNENACDDFTVPHETECDAAP